MNADAQAEQEQRELLNRLVTERLQMQLGALLMENIRLQVVRELAEKKPDEPGQ